MLAALLHLDIFGYFMCSQFSWMSNKKAWDEEYIFDILNTKKSKMKLGITGEVGSNVGKTWSEVEILQKTFERHIGT